MGIDAKILIKVRGEAPSDNCIAEWSWRLGEAIGAKHFGLDATSTPPRRALNLSRAYNYEDGEEVELAPGKFYSQDGPTIQAEDNETFLEVSLWGRYYGPGYERGDILSYCAIAEWIEQNIPNSEVWYGGDSGGYCVERFDRAARAAMKFHLYGVTGRDYYRERMPMSREEVPVLRPPACGICPDGKSRHHRFGWGENYAAFHCYGCGKSVVTRDNGVTWKDEKKD